MPRTVMITRRRLLLFGLPMVALGVAWLLWPRPGVTLANAARIRAGMALTEVEAILGDPGPDAWAEAWVGRFGRFSTPIRAEEVAAEHYWVGSECAVCVLFDRDGCVITHRAGRFPPDVPPRPLGLEEVFRMVRRWFGL